MTDDSAMSLTLAYSALYSNPLNQKPSLREGVDALEHYTVSLRLVSEQLNRLTGVGWDGMVTIVVGLAAYDVSPVAMLTGALPMTQETTNRSLSLPCVDLSVGLFI